MTFPQRGERDNWHGSSPSEHAMFATNGGARPGPEAFVFKTDGAVLDVDVIFGKGPNRSVDVCAACVTRSTEP